jgi:tRNA(Ile)-lysidine synthase
VNGAVARPLLPFSRQDIQVYANQHKLKWRDDSSNASTKYLRNKLRHEVIPILKEINPQLLQNFQNTLRNLNDTADIVEESVNRISENAVEKIDETSIKLKISEFKKLNNPKAYLHELIKDYGFTEWQDVVSLLEAQSGKQVFSSTHRLLKDREYLILTELVLEEDSQIISISEEDNNVLIPVGMLHFDEVSQIETTKSNILYVDKECLKYPLTVRKWQEGDVFYPLGMKGKKKLSKYLKDEKQSLIDKENIWLLISGDAIVWVISKRADDRFKVTGKTKQILKIELK